jgi:hypothetical protein
MSWNAFVNVLVPHGQTACSTAPAGVPVFALWPKCLLPILREFALLDEPLLIDSKRPRKSKGKSGGDNEAKAK